MAKIKKNTHVCFMLGMFFCFFLVGLTFASDPVLDQSYEEVLGNYGYLLTNSDNLVQTFKPTKNTINAVEVYLLSQAIDIPINFKLIDESTGAIVAEASPVQNEGDGWMRFDFTSNPISVTPNQTYGIKLNLGNNYATKWATNSINNYQNGIFKAAPSRDALFRVYGQDTVKEITVTEKKEDLPAKKESGISSPKVDTPDNENTVAKPLSQNYLFIAILILFILTILVISWVIRKKIICAKRKKSQNRKKVKSVDSIKF